MSEVDNLFEDILDTNKDALVTDLLSVDALDAEEPEKSQVLSIVISLPNKDAFEYVVLGVP